MRTIGHKRAIASDSFLGVHPVTLCRRADWPEARVHAPALSTAQTRFTALLFHINQEPLGRAFGRKQRRAAAGVDENAVLAYEQNLAANLLDLHRRIHTGRYRPSPMRCV